MAKNQYVTRRTAHVSFTPENDGSSATTHTSGMRIPQGAVLKGINLVTPGGVTNKGDASATLKPQIAGNQIAATLNASDLADSESLVTTAISSNVITAGGELQLVESTSNNSSFDGTFDMIVEYLYV